MVPARMEDADGRSRPVSNGSAMLRERALAETAVRRARLEEKLRLAYLQGAEERSRSALGRGLTRNELERVMARFRPPFEHEE